VNNADSSKTFAFLRQMETYGNKHQDREMILEVEKYSYNNFLSYINL